MSWLPTLALANALAGLALLSIASSLVTLARRTRIPYPGLLVLFSACLAVCGLGRIIAIWSSWQGNVWAVPAVNLLAAVASVTAAVCLRRMLPKLVKAVQGLTLSETRRRMLEDYSDELKAVNTLREREARDFEAIVASSSDQIYRIGADGKFEYLSPAVTRFFGLTKADLFGKSWEHLPLDEETRRILGECQAEVYRNGREARGSVSVRSAEGLRHFDYLCSPIFERKEVIAVTFNFRDVTEKRVFETELARTYSELERRVQQRTEELSVSQKRFQELVNTIDGIVWESDVGKPGFTFVGSQAERITGHATSKWLGEHRFWQRILHPDDLAKITGDRYLKPEQKKDLKTEYRILTSDGRIVWVRDHVRVIFENDQPVKMRGIMVDVTEQKKAEEELVKEREVSLRAARVKSEFLMNMSHEIRTPLNAIIGMSSLALDCRLDPDAREYLSTVKTAADSLLMLVNDILDFSKLEADCVQLEMCDFRVESVVKNALDVVQPLALEKDVSLRIEPGAALRRDVQGDPGRLLQILLNLLSNAVKFTPKGGAVTVTVCAERDDGPIRFQVRDSGIGIEPEAQGRLFRPFIQADSSTARRFGGTGLGLSICKHLVELMKGRIGLESEPGKGSLFWFEVPLAAGMPGAAEEDSETTASPLPMGARILVADDNPANQKVILRFLEKLGYTPEVVTNGSEALSAIRSRRFDAVLMDCQMPEMDGYEATRRLRELEAAGPGPRTRTPVIALTAHALAGDRDKCREAGMDDYLSKPVTLRTLSLTLEKWVRRAQRGACTEPSASVPVIDQSYLQTLLQLNDPSKEDILRELAHIFFDTAESKLAVIRSASLAGAQDQTRYEAHFLKSTSFNVGAARLAEACQELERLAESAPPTTFAERRELLLKRLEREASAARFELRRLLEARKDA